MGKSPPASWLPKSFFPSKWIFLSCQTGSPPAAISVMAHPGDAVSLHPGLDGPLAVGGLADLTGLGQVAVRKGWRTGDETNHWQMSPNYVGTNHRSSVLLVRSRI